MVARGGNTTFCANAITEAITKTKSFSSFCPGLFVFYMTLDDNEGDDAQPCVPSPHRPYSQLKGSPFSVLGFGSLTSPTISLGIVTIL